MMLFPSAAPRLHGNNLDYRGFVSGVTVNFPVFALGAPLFHCGKITGKGIKVSFDVKFIVNLLKGKNIMDWKTKINITTTEGIFNPFCSSSSTCYY